LEQASAVVPLRFRPRPPNLRFAVKNLASTPEQKETPPVRKKSTELVPASSASWETLSERFERRLLPAFKRRTEEVGRLLPELYLHGLAQGDFDLASRGAPMTSGQARNLSGLPTVRATKTTEALGVGG